VRRQRPENPIVLAFLEMMQPGLEEAIAELVEEGASSIMVFPLFMAQGGHLKGDVPRLLEKLRAAYPHVPIALESALGDVPEITGAIASWVVQRSE
jgi:sirohydrochlorin cobaltochelatase